MNFYEREAWILERHNYWCNVIEIYGYNAYGPTFKRKLTKNRPVVKLDGKVRQWAGRCSQDSKLCTYSVLYAFKIGDEYDETIAHEVCHAYQKHYLPRCKSHGEMFFYLLRTVCGFMDAKRTHGDWDRMVLTTLKLAYEIYQMENPRNGAC